MSVLYIMLGIAIVLLGVALSSFFWAVYCGQYDDMDTPPHRMLFDDDMDKS